MIASRSRSSKCISPIASSRTSFCPSSSMCMWSRSRAFSSGGKNDTFVGGALGELLPPIASFIRLTSCRSNNNCRRISSRSACSDDWFTRTGRLSFLICWNEPSFSSTISTVIRSPFCRTSILSTKFFNSRTLPGQL